MVAVVPVGRSAMAGTLQAALEGGAVEYEQVGLPGACAHAWCRRLECTTVAPAAERNSAGASASVTGPTRGACRRARRPALPFTLPAPAPPRPGPPRAAAAAGPAARGDPVRHVHERGAGGHRGLQGRGPAAHGVCGGGAKQLRPGGGGRRGVLLERPDGGAAAGAGPGGESAAQGREGVGALRRRPSAPAGTHACRRSALSRHPIALTGPLLYHPPPSPPGRCRQARGQH